MTEQESILQGVSLGKKAMQSQIVELLESMKSKDKTDTDYSMSNVITIEEAINLVSRLGK